ncbi:unnamed protein product [Heligmosomoides polygyrus]|uniref:Death domain-containing protein n=1 Tax=Heligmosomoides polygyrus TaxID=6339 RepID=A0A183FQ81_HELPZ|nr:unnamed protein product [Heligmosomoides polygyrus]
MNRRTHYIHLFTTASCAENICIPGAKRPQPAVVWRHQLTHQSTSTADLVVTDVIADGGRSESVATYKKEVRDKSTVTTPSLDSEVQPTKATMQDQTTSTYQSPVHSPLPPLVVLEDAPDTDVSLPDFREQFSDIESSSIEDLLAIDTRPSSSNRKSVTFSDHVDVESISPDIRKKSPSPDSYNFTVKPILKKEDKQAESMRRLLEYAAQRLYRDLLMLVEERDRAMHALELTPEDEENVLTPQTSVFQRVWLKLKDMALDDAAASFVYGVRSSSQLTLNVKRRFNSIMKETYPMRRKSNCEMMLTNEFSTKASQIHEQLRRHDSLEEDRRSTEDLLKAVSRIIENREKLAC